MLINRESQAAVAEGLSYQDIRGLPKKPVKAHAWGFDLTLLYPHTEPRFLVNVAPKAEDRPDFRHYIGESVIRGAQLFIDYAGREIGCIDGWFPTPNTASDLAPFGLTPSVGAFFQECSRARIFIPEPYLPIPKLEMGLAGSTRKALEQIKTIIDKAGGVEAL